MAEKPKLIGKPSLPNKSSSQSSGQPKPNSGGGKPPAKKVNQNGGGGNSNNPPSPWLDPDNEPKPDQTASFVEYLRWMREPSRNPDSKGKDPTDPTTKIQILQMATEKANYGDLLKILNQRTELIAGKANTFDVSCPWRIRVGGHRGPESILLPAFDALGIPFIPSSTLRGVARNQAVREILDKNPDWQTLMAGDRQNETIKKKIQKIWDDTHKQLAPYFGSLDADKKDQAGKIVFLDAYPIAGKFNLEMDMANNIWTWEGTDLKYAPNPNAFLSLNKTSFLIGLKLVASETNQQLLKQVQDWLIAGLANGAGSQVNTGYGQLLKNTKQSPNNEFLKVEFTLEGQLIHGYQKFTQWQKNNHGNWQMRGQAQSEVRPTAFKSMLRYWFRVFALGVISPADVQTWEGKIFGAITPTQSYYGYLRVHIGETFCDAKKNKMEGTLKLSFSPEIQNHEQEMIEKLIKSLTWLMFHLGGVGQGARRPFHNRSTNPRIRGSQLDQDFFDKLPDNPKKFVSLLRSQIKSFYNDLFRLTRLDDSCNILDLGGVEISKWREAADQNCRIIVVSSDSSHDEKGFALATLHNRKLKLSESRYDENLCGTSLSNPTKPSPVLIKEFDDVDYEVVVVFGAAQLDNNLKNPRRSYLSLLKKEAEEFYQAFPFTLTHP